MINRRDFIKSSALLAGGLLLPTGSIFGALFQESGGSFKRLLNDVGYYYNKGGTICWYIVKDTIIVVDAQFPDSAKDFMQNVQKHSKKKISALINTHHHYDHTGGNSYLKEFTEKIVAHKNCVTLQKKLNTKKDPNMVTADTTFEDNLKLDFGSEKLTISHFGPAHTGGDALVLFENSNHVHMGDIVFNKVYPYYQSEDGGSLQGWITVLERALGTYERDTFYTFGHGATEDNIVGESGDLIDMKDYLSRLLDFVGKEIKAGKKKSKILANTAIPGVKNRKELWPDALKYNIEAAYLELTKKK